MADGDIVHGRPNYFYKKAYEAVCENRSDSSHTLMGALLRQIKLGGGNAPIMLAKQMGGYVAQEIEKGNISWSNLSRELDNIKNQYLGKAPRRYLEIALRAGKKIINELRYKNEKETNNLKEKIIRQYMKELLQSEFQGKIDSTSKHHSDIDSQTLIKRVENITPEIDNVIDKRWAKKAIEYEDVSKLRRPNRKDIQPIDMDEDLL